MTDTTNFCPCCVELTRENEALRAEVRALKAKVLSLLEDQLDDLQFYGDTEIRDAMEPKIKQLEAELKEQADAN